MMEYLTAENALEAFEFLFWPALWIVTYVCVLALVIDQFGRLFPQADPAEYAIGARGQGRKRGLRLMGLGVLGFLACSAVWTALFGDLGRELALLAAHLHGAHDYREVAVLSISTLSILVADIGSILFLDSQVA